MLNGDITPDLPASILQLHPDVTLILDKGAASELIEEDIK
jgi:glucosamine-6-phosphate deaminase